MIRTVENGLVIYRFDGKWDSPCLLHAVYTRLGGVSGVPYATLNLGHTVGDDIECVEENHRRALGAVGIGVHDVVTPYQVHGSRVAVVGAAHRGTVQPGCDGLVTAEAGVPLLLRFADCVPVLVFDDVRGAVGLAHAGWRGVASNIAAETVRVMVQRIGSRPHQICAAIGPAIGPCCYEVDDAVAYAVSDSCPPGASVTRSEGTKLFLDLPAAVEAQLSAAGVQDVEQAHLCTACHVDEFFSHRRDRGTTGRFGVVIGMTR